jgi:hypothetical protein
MTSIWQSTKASSAMTAQPSCEQNYFGDLLYLLLASRGRHFSNAM